MHRYYNPIQTDIHPIWLAVPAAVWIILICIYASIPVIRHEAGVRHALPDPYVPQCYDTEWRGGKYCEMPKLFLVD